MTNTEDLDVVAKEFYDRYVLISDREEAMLQEIVDLRKEVNNLYEENESLLHERAGDNW